jgi:NAD(P)-dependent dehydrogenase (short-subunit alcohol dehydrogenase family)
MARLEGKVALVTGGSSGIGFATARRFVEEGARVFITGRRKAELEAAARELGERVTPIQADAARLPDLDRLFATIEKAAGRVDVLFANAGVAEAVPLAEIDEQHFDRIFDVNVKGVLFTVQKALRLMPDGAAIILNGSVVGSKGFPGRSVYSATKAAIRSFARTWTSELKARGIRVNVVSPGVTSTPGLEKLQGAPTAALETAYRDRVPLGRLGRAEEIANAVVFLASPESSYVAGAELFVDGGIAQV